MKKTFDVMIILIIFSLLLWGGWAEGQTAPDKLVARLGKGMVYAIDYSPNGDVLLVAGSLGICLYDANNLTEVGLLQGHGVFSFAFSPDGKILASRGGRRENTIHLWDFAGRREIAVLEGHTDGIYSVAFSPDGKMLASGGGYEDKAVRLWDVAGRNEIAVLRGHTWDVSSVAFSPDGKIFASGSGDGVLLWGELPTSVEPKGKKALTWGEAKRTALLQNYPNPFNPETWLPFELANESDVILRIYDVKGSLVRDISSGRKLAGSYTEKLEAIRWDGRNELGERVSSGVYFYQLVTPTFQQTKRMLILK